MTFLSEYLIDYFNDSFNTNHPELAPGEMFYSNITTDKVKNRVPKHNNERIGLVAYSPKGEKLIGCVPVFITSFNN